jgi:tetratricopeptide (TPR) repeat protein
MRAKAVLMISTLALVFTVPVIFFPSSGQGRWGDSDWDEKEDYYPIYEDGKALFYAGKYNKAKRKFKRVLDLSERNRGANRYLGRIYLKEGNYHKAIKYLMDALRETSGGYRRQTLYYLAKAFEGAHQYSKALYIWKEYVRRLTPPADERQKRWLSIAREKVRSLRAKIREQSGNPKY